MKHVLTIIILLVTRLLHSQDKPNIVLILADDLGYGDLSCYGSKDVQTPNLDKLAAEGVRFTNFYANAPECSPTRAALLTGRYQQRIGGIECAIGLDDIGRYEEALELSNRKELGLPVELNAIPFILNQKGYQTAIIGKWHLGGLDKFRPKAHGFDYSIGILGGAVDYFHHSEPFGDLMGIMMEGNNDFYRNNIPQHREGYYMTNLITDESIEWINIQNKSNPFFLYVAYTTPHTPIQGPDDYTPEKKTSENWNKGDKETYKAMIESMDKGIGRIMEKLKDKDFAENTIVIFLSDNGCTQLGDTGPLRGNKAQLFEGGIRVPCMIKWPGKISPSRVSNQVAIGMDITASISKIIDVQPSKPFDGIDIIEHIVSGNSDYVRTLFWRYKRADIVRKAIRDNTMKYVYEKTGNGTTEYLFDLENDIGEKNNLIDSHKRDLVRLKKSLHEWEAEVIPERYNFYKKFSN